MKKTIEYLKRNLPQFYNKYEVNDHKCYITLDKQLPVDQLVIYHDCDIPQFCEYREKYQIIDKFRCAEIHVFNNNTLLLLISHGLSDGGYAKRLLSFIINNINQEIKLLDSIFDVFKSDYEIYKQKLANKEYDSPYLNSFKIVEDNKFQKLYVETVRINMNNYTHLQHRISQRLIIANSLYKLYVLQKQGKLTNIDDLLVKGIAISQPYIADANKYLKQKAHLSCAALCFYENYLLVADKTVDQYCQQFTDSLKYRGENYEQYSFLKRFDDIAMHEGYNKGVDNDTNNNDNDNQNKQQVENNHTTTESPNSNAQYIINSFQFSNVGFANNQQFQKVSMDFYTTSKITNETMSFSFTFNGIFECCYHCTEEFKNYNLTKVLTLLLTNMTDNIQIGKLWELIKDI